VARAVGVLDGAVGHLVDPVDPHEQFASRRHVPMRFAFEPGPSLPAAVELGA
jgi:hypothetical protein